MCCVVGGKRVILVYTGVKGRRGRVLEGGVCDWMAGEFLESEVGRFEKSCAKG
jgi:hypothetical protein